MTRVNDISPHLMPPLQEASRLIVACRPDDFCASALARAVEDSDAHLVNLNVTGRQLDDGRITIDLRTNRRNARSAARSLERYGYEVISTSADDSDNADDDPAIDVFRSRAAELLHLINI